jgi:hypothetical protein
VRFKCKFLFVASLCLVLVKPGYTQEKKSFWSRFSLKLAAGVISAGSLDDVNDALESFNNNEVFDSLRKANSDLLIGQIETLDNQAFDWEAEIRFDLTQRIGFGMAVAAPFHAQKESNLTYMVIYDDGLYVRTWSYKPEVKVSSPIKLSVYYSYSFIPRLNISIGAGAGVYPSKIAQTIRRVEIWSEGEYPLNYDLKTKRNFALGYHGTAALEYSLSDRLAVVAEFQMRRIRISSLTGNEKGPDLWGGYYDVNGTLYYYSTRNPNIGASYTKLRIFEDPVPDDPSLVGLREAVLNLSGYSIRIGIRIRPF